MRSLLVDQRIAHASEGHPRLSSGLNIRPRLMWDTKRAFPPGKAAGLNSSPTLLPPAVPVFLRVLPRLATPKIPRMRKHRSIAQTLSRFLLGCYQLAKCRPDDGQLPVSNSGNFDTTKTQRHTLSTAGTLHILCTARPTPIYQRLSTS